MMSSSRMAGVAALLMARASSRRLRWNSRWLWRTLPRRDMVVRPSGVLLDKLSVELFDFESIVPTAAPQPLFPGRDEHRTPGRRAVRGRSRDVPGGDVSSGRMARGSGCLAEAPVGDPHADALELGLHADALDVALHPAGLARQVVVDLEH